MGNAAYTPPAGDPAAYVSAAQCTAGIQFLIDVGEAAPSRYAKQDLFFPRIDYHINSKNDAFVDFNFANFKSHQRLHFDCERSPIVRRRPMPPPTITSVSWWAA